MRLGQERRIFSAEVQTVYKQLLEDWEAVFQMPAVSEVALEASALARSRNLRGADAVHLASAARLSRETKGVRFLSFDDRLNVAASELVKLWEE
ncbi:MAG: hypothetical protein C4331_13680 [Meiothermus sp.]